MIYAALTGITAAVGSGITILAWLTEPGFFHSAFTDCILTRLQAAAFPDQS